MTKRDPVFEPFLSFFKKEVSSSIVLLFTTFFALLWANSFLSETYYPFWHQEISITLGRYSISKDLKHWIDEGLMTLFFFTVGLEIKREVLIGELSSLRKAILPVAAATGGMILPALLYTLFNAWTPTAKGWGIPMATDIAFALGALAAVGRRVPPGLRVFLAAFAIADDLGAVLVIAFFYTKEIAVDYLIIAALIVLILLVMNLLWVRWVLLYALAAIALWLSILGSGLHATVAGVILAMFIPAKGMYEPEVFLKEVNESLKKFRQSLNNSGKSILLRKDQLNAVQSIELACHHVETPLQRLEHHLHSWVSFVIIPLFTLANAGVTVNEIDLLKAFGKEVSLGILTGLFVGKPAGIALFACGAVRTGFATLPEGVRWIHIIGAGFLGGIGFTMSLFIGGLSFVDKDLMDLVKLAILTASALSGTTGILILWLSGKGAKGEGKIA